MHIAIPILFSFLGVSVAFFVAPWTARGLIGALFVSVVWTAMSFAMATHYARTHHADRATPHGPLRIILEPEDWR